jgi:hypothetical protein
MNLQLRHGRTMAVAIALALVSTTVIFAAPRHRLTVAIVSPAAGASVTGSVAVAGTATDPTGVARIDISVDSGPYVAATGTATWTYAWDTSAIADGNHTVKARATNTAGNTSSTSISLTVSNVTAPPPTPPPSSQAAGQIPTGLPSRFTVGLYEESNTWMHASGVRWDTRYRYFTYGWANNWGWSAFDGSWGLSYLKECDSIGTIPAVQYYVLNGLANYDESAVLKTLQDPSKMLEYYKEWKLLMQRAKEFGKPVVVLAEADAFGFLESQAKENPSTYAAVAASGMPELASLPDTVAGWGLAFLQLRASVGATNAVLAMDISGWATGKDLLYFSVTDSLQPEVDKAFAFLSPLGLAANQTGQTWDLVTNNPLERDSDYYTTIGQNRWWDASDSASVSSASFNRYAEWLRLWNVTAGKRWLLWQVPLGNSNHLNVYNNGNPREGYRDNRPEYFFSSGGDAHRQTFANDGVIGVLFGPGTGGMSYVTNDVYTDGALFMQSHAGAFLNAGGLPIN